MAQDLYMKVWLICLTEIHLLSKKIAFNGIPLACEIARNDDQFGKFKNLAVLYNKQNF